MPLTPEQLQTLKADILANPAVQQWITPERRDDLIAAYYNEPASPAFTVWRTSISKDEVYGNGFTWAQIDNVNEPRWRIWRELFDNDARTMNPSKTNVRQGVAEVWTGTAAKELVRDYVLGKCKRTVNRAERLFVTGAGTGVTPGLMGWEGTVDTNLISSLLNEV